MRQALIPLKNIRKTSARHPAPLILNLSLYHHLVEKGKAAGWEEESTGFLLFFCSFLKTHKSYSHCLMVAFKLDKLLKHPPWEAAAILSPQPHIPSFPDALHMFTITH